MESDTKSFGKDLIEGLEQVIEHQEGKIELEQIHPRMTRAKCLACGAKDDYADLSGPCTNCRVVGRLAPLVVVHVPDKARESAYVRLPKETER